MSKFVNKFRFSGELVDEEIKKQLILIIQKYLPGCKIYLFGSRAKGTYIGGADIDLALDFGNKIDWQILARIHDSIEATTVPVFVDLVDVYSVESNFLEAIKKEWIQWTN